MQPVRLDGAREAGQSSRMTDAQLTRIAKALADGRRFAILEMVAATDGELACKRLVATFPVSQATISHHLKELATAGLIEVRREAQQVFLQYRPETMAAYLAAIGRRLPGRTRTRRRR
jgi:ArsR family transcriptional regulator, arsenate/arsenite/antimonite-responsive transcriptional repressor